MKVTLTKVKHAAFASQETNCFEAVVVIDGVPSIHVSNNGNGGCDLHRDIVPGSFKRLAAYAASLPLEDTMYGKMQPTPDTIVGDLLTNHLSAKDLRRRLKKHALYILDGKMMVCKPKPGIPCTQSQLIEFIKKKHPNAQILNSMPEEEALKLYLQPCT